MKKMKSDNNKNQFLMFVCERCVFVCLIGDGGGGGGRGECLCECF